MALWLREDTATTIVVGPLVDSVDATKEEGLTIIQSEILLWKHGGTGFSAKNESSAATHRSYGMYTVPLDSTDTNTPGQLIVGVYEAGIMVARENFMVVPQQQWDSLFGSERLHVDVKEIASIAAAATKLGVSTNVMVQGTVTDSGHSPTTTAFKASDITEATDDHFIGRVVIFTSGNLIYQATSITDYTGSTSVYTVDALTEAPATGDTFVIV
jgi:hypothetical protein